MPSRFTIETNRRNGVEGGFAVNHMHSPHTQILKAALCAVLLASPLAGAAIHYVNNSSTPPTQDGLTWSSAFTTIQPAIAAAFADGGGEIWIAEGVYNEPRVCADPDTGLNMGALYLKEGVSLFGGFAGTELARHQRDTLRRRTVIDGSIARNGEPARQVVVAAGNTTLDGLEIRGGDAGFRSAIGGGVIVERQANVRIAGCLITENTGVYGAGLRITFSENVLVERCTIAANHARGDAGIPALYVADSTVEMRDCAFDRNDFPGDEYNGACVRIDGGSTRFFGCSFTRNSGTPLHIEARDGLAHELLDCDFTGNDGLRGPGALRYFGQNTSGEFRLERCTFLANRADAPTLRICENGELLATGLGFAKTITLRNCAVVNNAGDSISEPTVLVGGANFVFDHCTFAGNDSPADRSTGVVMHLSRSETSDAPNPLLIRNSLLWNGSPAEFNLAPVTAPYSMPEIENSIVRGGFPGANILESDPRLLDLTTDDFRLAPASPAIDTAQFFAPLAEDVFGSARPAGPASDLGAHEWRTEAPALCESAALSEEQFAQLIHANDPFSDLDRDGLPELASLRLLAAAACSNPGSLGAAANRAFSLNSDAATTEVFDTRVLRREALIAALMSVSASAQSALRDALAESGAVLLQDYAIVNCGLSAHACEATPANAPAGPNEALSGPGDFDGDGTTNADEWTATLAAGGTLEDFIAAATNSATLGGSGGGGGGGCFIATAAYGTSLSDDIDALRAVRDDRLLHHPLGTAFTDAYYRISPPIADALATRDGLRAAVRRILEPIVAAAQRLNAARE